MKEIVRRAIELLKDKNYSRVCLDLTEVNWEELRRRIIEILTDKRGELGIPKDDIHPIHRLDNAVGGTIIYALSKKSASLLSKLVSERRITKEYLAVIHGKPPVESAVFKDYLFKYPVIK